jgi:hypothetical protein
VVIQTSPDDLLTRQTPSSAATALETAVNATTIASIRPTLPALMVELSTR